MTLVEVRRVAEPLLKAVFSDAIESIELREEEDWSGTPSLYIDVFLAAGTAAPEPDVWAGVRRTLSDTLVASDEVRFPYVRLRDRQEESEDAPDEAA